MRLRRKCYEGEGRGRGGEGMGRGGAGRDKCGNGEGESTRSIFFMHRFLEY